MAGKGVEFKGRRDELLDLLTELRTYLTVDQEGKLDLSNTNLATILVQLINIFTELGGVSTMYDYNITRDANNRITQIVIIDALTAAVLKTIDITRDVNGYIVGTPAITEA